MSDVRFFGCITKPNDEGSSNSVLVEYPHNSRHILLGQRKGTALTLGTRLAKIKDVTRCIKKAVVAATLEEMRTKAAEKFGKLDTVPTIHFDCDGTEVDDEEYFRTLEPNAELIAVFPGERWVDATHYVTISSRRNTLDQTDAENAQLKKLVGQLQNNLCDVSVVSGPDLDSLSNMDPNSLVDITGKDFMDSIKDSTGRHSDQRTSSDAAKLLESLAAIYNAETPPSPSNTTSSIMVGTSRKHKISQDTAHSRLANENDIATTGSDRRNSESDSDKGLTYEED